MIVRPKIRIDGILYRDRGRPVWGESQSNKGEEKQECMGIHKVLKKTKRKKCYVGHRRDSQKSKMPKREEVL